MDDRVKECDGSRFRTACNARNSHISDFCTVQNLYCPLGKASITFKISFKKTRKCIFKKHDTHDFCSYFTDKLKCRLKRSPSVRKGINTDAHMLDEQEKSKSIKFMEEIWRHRWRKCFQHYWQSHGQRWSDVSQPGWCWFAVNKKGTKILFLHHE